MRAEHAADLGLEGRSDRDLFDRARRSADLIVTRDHDFVQILDRRGPPPRVLWITCGNCRNRELWQHVREAWPRVTALLDRGEPLIEISGRWPPRL